jgi:hypothetical protein
MQRNSLKGKKKVQFHDGNSEASAASAAKLDGKP